MPGLAVFTVQDPVLVHPLLTAAISPLGDHTPNQCQILQLYLQAFKIMSLSCKGVCVGGSVGEGVLGARV